MFCKKCGAELNSYDKFCFACGANTSDSDAAVMAEPVAKADDIKEPETPLDQMIKEVNEGKKSKEKVVCQVCKKTVSDFSNYKSITFCKECYEKFAMLDSDTDKALDYFGDINFTGMPDLVKKKIIDSTVENSGYGPTVNERAMNNEAVLREAIKESDLKFTAGFFKKRLWIYLLSMFVSLTACAIVDRTMAMFSMVLFVVGLLLFCIAAGGAFVHAIIALVYVIKDLIKK